MKIIDLSTGKTVATVPKVNIIAAIGNFDGVHRGHQSLIDYAVKNRNEGKSAVWTFSSPTSLILGRTNDLLTTTNERLKLFQALGIDLVFAEDFEAIRDMSTAEFAKMLIDSGITAAVCGTDFRYGKGAIGTANTLKNELAVLGANAMILPPVEEDGLPISSTRLRNLLKNGEIEATNRMLGRCFALEAPVESGKLLGRTLGFPTANQRFAENSIVLKHGVYATRVINGNKTYAGVTNVGVRPTVENTVTANSETHILDFCGDLYGKTIKVEFCKFLRCERKYESVDKLRQAIEQDIECAREYFHK